MTNARNKCGVKYKYILVTGVSFSVARCIFGLILGPQGSQIYSTAHKVLASTTLATDIFGLTAIYLNSIKMVRVFKYLEVVVFIQGICDLIVFLNPAVTYQLTVFYYEGNTGYSTLDQFLYFFDVRFYTLWGLHIILTMLIIRRAHLYQKLLISERDKITNNAIDANLKDKKEIAIQTKEIKEGSDVETI
jgi:hypothetical protein